MFDFHAKILAVSESLRRVVVYAASDEWRGIVSPPSAMPKIKDKLEGFEYLTQTQQESKMGIFSDAADKVKAEQIAAGWKPFVPLVGAAAPMSVPPPDYRTFTLADGREYEARYLAGRCSSGGRRLAAPRRHRWWR